MARRTKEQIERERLVCEVSCARCGDYYDLSYRSTFNDEPGSEDIPKPDIIKAIDERIVDLATMRIQLGEPWLSVRALLCDLLGWRDSEKTQP